MKQISVRVDEDLLAAIERTRGDVPRERWLRSVLKRETGRAESNARALAVPPPVPILPPSLKGEPMFEDGQSHEQMMRDRQARLEKERKR